MSRKAIILGSCIAAILGITVGVLIGYFSRQIPVQTDQTPKSMKEPQEQNVIADIKAENIKENLRFMTLEPHLAGTEQDKTSAEYLVKKWKEYGIEEASIIPYDILLSYPGNETSRNQAFIYENDGTIVHETAKMEKILDQDQNNSLVVPPFNAYAKAGTPESSDLIYVNYGRIEDFMYLERDENISCTGKIVIARYGKIYRGDKIRHASMYGATGMLLYSDPKDYAPDPNVKVFPESWWLPGTGVQRGSAKIKDGDPLTPGYPSTDYAFRYGMDTEEVIEDLPKIPCHPIGYDDARHFLESMSGEEVPEDWRGTLNVTYKFGGPLKNGRKLKVAVYNTQERRKTYNAVGVIRGEYEPDRYVLLGNHRDAWVFGAVDPTSGTASLLEVSRVFGELLKTGWRPRRTIVFCSWGAEEYGLIGSNEWAEEYIKNLAERAVAYINVDIAVEWHYVLHVGASPLLNQAIYDATKKIPDPDSAKFANLYEAWKTNARTPEGQTPKISYLGSGSDYAPFFQRVGVPSIDMSYTFDDKKWDISGYPLYHSVYETYALTDKFTDPTFEYHQTLGRLCAELTRSLSDPLILPFNVNSYSTALTSMFAVVEKEHKARIENKGLTLTNLQSAVNHFETVASSFQTSVEKVKEAAVKDPFQLRMINDQMMLLERAFIDPAGLPGRFFTKHVIFAPSSKNLYAGSNFPGLTDALFDIDNLEGDEAKAAWELVEQQLAVATFTIYSAASTIDEVTNLYRK